MINLGGGSRSRRSQVFWVIVAILWMALIFVLSAEPAPVSSSNSMSVAREVLRLTEFFHGVDVDLNTPEVREFVERFNDAFRMFAHGAAYMVLGILVFQAMKGMRRARGNDQAYGMGISRQNLHFTGIGMGLGNIRRSRRKRWGGRRLFWAALTFCVLYAVSDEIHQMYVPGRSMQWQDLVMDTFGILAGLLLCGIVGALNRE